MGKSRGRGGHLARAQWLFLGCVTKLAAADYRTEELAISSSGVLKCNVAAAWDSESKNSGAAWVVRDSTGEVLFHSRRSFARVQSLVEVELIGLAGLQRV